MGSGGTPRAAGTGPSAEPTQRPSAQTTAEEEEETHLLTDNVSDDEQDGKTDKHDRGDRRPGELLQG
jgi:hypothetical protein